ncbi:hypothetical protein O3Q52_17335 [Streptomyces sp. ActVer]|uniref:hypothetical protein n=1 Tax=Streptomyces sp. ActVer TaxID=3014558 RepID=UPI0022B360C9|nr:hypothetical protein [Streptomyces sp. ActVer]MCZ4509928.1 hypothetical protein [Streptomyces sp. ActVer]
MIITDRIPILRGPGRRRAVDEVERLRRNEIAILTNLHAAGDDIALLQQDLDEARRKQAETDEIVAQQQASNDDLIAERDEWRGEALRLRAKFGPQLAAEANANRITVPPGFRRVDGPEDEATGPIDVTELRAQYNRPIPLHESPLATTNPGWVPPSWAVRDEPATT